MRAFVPIVLLCACLSASAEDKPIFVEEIVVEGEAVADTATTHTVTAEEIRERGAATVAEVLDLIPGVDVRVGGRGEAYAQIRGFTQREVTVLIDGVPVAVPYDGQLDLASLPVESIERIEVVKGASSVLYGANAMGGVINIITKRSDGALRGSVHARYSPDEDAGLDVLHQGAVGGVRYQVVAGYVNRDSYRLPSDYPSHPNQGTGQRENSDREGWSAQASAGWDVGKRGRASVNLSHVDREYGIPHHESDPEARYWRFTDWNRSRLDVVYDRDMARGSLKAKAYYDSYENVLDSYDDRTYTTQESEDSWTSSFDDEAYGADFFLRRTFGDGWLLKLGARPRHEIHREQADDGEPWDRYEADLAAVPLELEWRPEGSRLTLTLGASLDWMEWQEREGDERSGSETSLSPQIAALFDVDERTVFRASVSRKTRFPQLKELFSGRSGNPDLETMKADIFETGVDWSPREDTKVSLVLFYNDVDDLIDRASRVDPYRNVNHAVFAGLETSLSWRRPSGASFDFSYTRLESEDRSGGAPQLLQYRPRHKLDVIASLIPAPKWNVRLIGSYVSSQVTDDRPAGRLSSYILADVRLSRTFGEGWEAYLLAHNLFDELYYESSGYPMEGRMVYAGLRYSY